MRRRRGSHRASQPKLSFSLNSICSFVLVGQPDDITNVQEQRPVQRVESVSQRSAANKQQKQQQQRRQHYNNNNSPHGATDFLSNDDDERGASEIRIVRFVGKQ